MTTAKICGINDTAAMEAALTGGASHVGLVFYPKSPRAVSPAEASEFSALATGNAVRVGLFVDPDDAFLDQVLAAVPLDLIQLHGGESAARVAAIREATDIAVMKAISVADAADIDRAQEYGDVADWLMFDAKPPKTLENALPGGNAVAFDWSLLAGKTWPKPWMLAGGLTAENVGQAILETGPDVVDISSGVEDQPGRKNPAKIKAFLAAVASAH
ncbi:MAG TPA: phosphoribosylanthranilate isomerase [Rhodospirillaceae bacterium]|nr:phosphoribosylanthranilate isomerase [Rhodospirillaceae bacterium]HAA92774.1 phosphoribosylanthranilate isomerase [Rhodospirillaceae bacterium]HAT35772.1 phosphoribosylanthranilate isomerase [Rhodospirillaceae bacterium]